MLAVIKMEVEDGGAQGRTDALAIWQKIFQILISNGMILQNIAMLFNLFYSGGERLIVLVKKHMIR